MRELLWKNLHLGMLCTSIFVHFSHIISVENLIVVTEMGEKSFSQKHTYFNLLNTVRRIPILFQCINQ